MAQRAWLRSIFPGTPHFRRSNWYDAAPKETNGDGMRTLRAYFSFLQTKFDKQKDRLIQRQRGGWALTTRECVLIDHMNLAWNCETVHDVKEYRENYFLWNNDGTPLFWNDLYALYATGRDDEDTSVTDEEAELDSEPEIESRWRMMVDVSRMICKLDDEGDNWSITKIMACEFNECCEQHAHDVAFNLYAEADGADRLPSAIPFSDDDSEVDNDTSTRCSEVALKRLGGSYLPVSSHSQKCEFKWIP
jgi:hypothetical protein